MKNINYSYNKVNAKVHLLIFFLVDANITNTRIKITGK